MATLIPEMSLTDFLAFVRKQGAQRLKRLKSCEITFNGEYLFTFVNGNADVSGYLRVQTEYKCQVANAVGGETLEQMMKQETVEV